MNIENGQASLSNYDIVQQAGVFTAKIEQFSNVSVADGSLTITFLSIVDNAKISGIEVISNDPVVNTAPTIISPITDKNLSYNTTSLNVPLSPVFADNGGFASLSFFLSVVIQIPRW